MIPSHTVTIGRQEGTPYAVTASFPLGGMEVGMASRRDVLGPALGATLHSQSARAGSDDRPPDRPQPVTRMALCSVHVGQTQCMG